jgi:hypothetical protein
VGSNLPSQIEPAPLGSRELNSLSKLYDYCRPPAGHTGFPAASLFKLI